MDPEVSSPPTQPRRYSWLLVIIIVISLVIAGVIYFRNHREKDFVSGFVSDPQNNLVSTNNRTNLVIMGYGGEGHEAGDLTDSIIFASLSHQDNSLTMLSIPRDIWVDTMAAKVNTAYHYGEERREGGGIDLAKSAVSEILDQPVHYALVLDFAGFTQAIDIIGGIDIEVKHTFDDYEYPIPGRENAVPERDRYEHLHFEAGPLHLDGATALKYARSRHAGGEEGTDFARSARQIQIILAFKDKLASSETYLDFDTLKQTYSSIRGGIRTDIQDGQLGSFFRFFLGFQQAEQGITTLNINDLFITPKNRSPYLGQWVLVPLDTWAEIHDYVAKNLSE